MLRSVRLFRLFLSEQSDPDGFYSALAHDAASQVARYADVNGRTVLDVGGGAGYVTAEFRSRGANCYLFELDADEMMSRGQTPPGAILADGYWLPVRDGAADICLSSNVLEHVRDPGGLRQKIEAPWFAYWLKDKGALPVKEATLFQTGSDTWTSFDAWPPREAQTRNLYFHADGKLSFESPTATATAASATNTTDTAFDSYLSDPAHPVPYRHRPIDTTYPDDHPGSWFTWLLQDQRFVDQRPDVLTWQTDTLTGDVTLAGQVTAKLFASTTGTDADWIVKLIDVYPESMPSDWKLSGYELMIADEVFRGRFRNSFEKPEPLPANAVTPFTIDLHTANHVFKKGHRIMVQVQSTWFPLIDRNPQTYVPNIFEAKESDFQSATHRIYRSQKYPSSVAISVIPAGTGASK